MMMMILIYRHVWNTKVFVTGTEEGGGWDGGRKISYGDSAVLRPNLYYPVIGTLSLSLAFLIYFQLQHNIFHTSRACFSLRSPLCLTIELSSAI
jgi:hypothetical protein